MDSNLQIERRYARDSRSIVSSVDTAGRLLHTFFLFFLCPVFYPVCLFSRDIDITHQRFGGHPGGWVCLAFHFF